MERDLLRAEDAAMPTTTFTPPQKMAANARRGLALREKFKRGGTAVGVRRARQLSDRHDLHDRDIKSIASYFARHAVDKNAASHVWGNEEDPSAGYIAWLLWGGDEGRDWAWRKRDEL